MGKNSQQQSQQQASQQPVEEVKKDVAQQDQGTQQAAVQSGTQGAAVDSAAPAAEASKPSETSQTTKAGQEAQAQEAQRQVNAAAVQAAKETPIVKQAVSNLSGGVSVRESSVEGPKTLAEMPVFQDAFKVAGPATKAGLGAFVGYLNAMDPKKSQSSESLARNQATFYNTLMTVLISEDENFATVWKAIVAGVKLHAKTVFSLTMCQRGLDSAPNSILDENGVRVMARLIQLLRVEAMVGNTPMLHKQIRLSDVTAALVNMRAKNNLTRYYSNQ